MQNNISESEAISILKKHAKDEETFGMVLSHSRAVQSVALRIGLKILSQGHDIDIQFIRSASILHDVGRFKYPPGKESIKHGIYGAQILSDEGLDERYSNLCERHIGAGIDEYDVESQKLDIPIKNYMPISVEEKVITYADNLIAGVNEISIYDAVKRFRNEVGERCAQRLIELHNDIEEFKGTKDFIFV